MAYTGNSIVDYLKSTGQDTSYANRAKLAGSYGIKNYSGLANENTQLLNSLRNATIKPAVPTVSPASANPIITNPSANTTLKVVSGAGTMQPNQPSTVFKSTVPNIQNQPATTPNLQASASPAGIPAVPNLSVANAPTPVANYTAAPQTKPTTPTTVTTPSGKTVNPATGGVITTDTNNNIQQPATIPAPAVPDMTAYDAAVKNVEKYTQLSDEEIAAQNELNALTESLRQGFQGEGDRPIPLSFITGRQQSLENRAATLAQPIQAKAALAQAKRMAALEASKTTMEAEKTKISEAKEASKPVTVSEGTVLVNPVTGKPIYANPKTTTGTKPTIVDINGVDYQVNADGTLSVPETPVQEAQIKATAGQLELLDNAIATAEKYAEASGRSGIRRDLESKFVGATDYTQLQGATNTIRTNILTLLTDPTIKKFFGPQMSNADVQLMMSGGTVLNPELQEPEQLKSELARLKDLLGRIRQSVNNAGTSTGGQGDDLDNALDSLGFKNGSGGTPTATKIAAAIKQVESGGNYNAKGGSGESGAYQFMPATWQAWAKQYLGNANAPMTQANQDKVAIAKIDDLIKKGYNAQQIALIWNGGSPTIKSGTNQYGVNYDTGAYATKVLNTLKNLG